MNGYPCFSSQDSVSSAKPRWSCHPCSVEQPVLMNKNVDENTISRNVMKWPCNFCGAHFSIVFVWRNHKDGVPLDIVYRMCVLVRFSVNMMQPASRLIAFSYWTSSTHSGRVTHICASKILIIGSDNGLAPTRRQAVIWTKAEILLIGSFGINLSKILIEKLYLH